MEGEDRPKSSDPGSHVWSPNLSETVDWAGTGVLQRVSVWYETNFISHACLKHTTTHVPVQQRERQSRAEGRRERDSQAGYMLRVEPDMGLMPQSCDHGLSRNLELDAQLAVPPWRPHLHFLTQRGSQ